MCARPPDAAKELADLDGRLELARDDLRAELIDLLHEGSRDVRTRSADADALVLQVEQEVAATLELASLGALDREIDAAIDALDDARQGVLGMQVVLVDVDADAPDPGVISCLQRAEAARTG